MSVVSEILATWRGPKGPVGRLLQAGPREDRSLIILMAATFLMFLARAPYLARQSALDPSVPLDARLGISLFVMMFAVPLLAYALAFGGHLVMRALGRAGQPYGARVALFWALLAVAPGALLHGMLTGFLGPHGTGVQIVGVGVFAAFLWFWIGGLAAAYPLKAAP